MSTLKRSATIAFGFETGYMAPDAIIRPQSAPATPQRKPALLSRTPSIRRAVGSRTPSLPRQPSINRSSSLLSSASTPSTSSHRSIKRQKTSHNVDWDSWEVIDVPLSSGEVVHSLRPMPLFPATIAASATNTSKYLYSTTSRLLATLGLVHGTAAGGLPHQPQPASLAINSSIPVTSDQEAHDIVLVEAEAQPDEMEVVTDEEEEACLFTLVHSDSTISDTDTYPHLPPSPFPAYTSFQWSLLSRHQRLLERVISKRCQTTRDGHARFVASGYTKEENPAFHCPVPRRTSPLAPYSPRPRAPVARSKAPAPLTTDRTVRAAQSPGYGPSRWANYPTCTKKYPGPDDAGSLLRNTLCLNFGDWLKQVNLWNTVNIGSLRMAMECYELLGSEVDGAATPTVSTPSGSVADLREFL